MAEPTDEPTEEEPKAAAKGALPRSRLSEERISGSFIAWRGTFGWVKPLEPVDHPEAEKRGGRIFVHKQDLDGDFKVKTGLKVDFVVYSDDSGLGAEECRPLEGEDIEPAPAKGEKREKRPKKVIKTISKKAARGKQGAEPLVKAGGGAAVARGARKWLGKGGKGKGKGKGKGDAEAGEPLVRAFGRAASKGKDGKGAKGKGAKGKGVKAPLVSARGSSVRVEPTIRKWSGAAGVSAKGSSKGASKGASKGSSKGSSKGPPERNQVRLGGRMQGEVAKWLGSFGWISPFKAIDHPAAAKKNGDIFCHLDDMEDGVKPKEGTVMDFFVYADKNGLGAEKCRRVAGGEAHLRRVQALSSSKGSSKGKSSATSRGGGKPVQTVPIGKAAGKGSVRVTAGPSTKAPNTPLGKGKGTIKAGSKGAKGGGKDGHKEPDAGGKARAPVEPTPKASAVAAAKGKGGKGAPAAAGAGGKGVQKTIGKGQAAPTKGGQVLTARPKARAGKPGPTAAPPSSKPDSNLPPNWQQHWSEEHKVPYYWNKVTKESSWTKPEK